MLPARLERIQASAKATAREIGDRRELLDWFLEARRDAIAAKEEGVRFMAAQAAAEAAKASNLEASPKSTKLEMLRSGLSGKLPEVPTNSPKFGKMAGSASAPALRAESRELKARPSLLTMGANVPNTMHNRVDKARQAAERNAREIGERRQTLDSFKEMRASMDQAKSGKLNLVAAFTAPMLGVTTLRTTGQVERLSYNSRLNFATGYALQNMEKAVKEIPPAYPVHPTSSMRNRLEACEARVLWNHQTMYHNQSFLDDYRRFASD